MIRWFKDTFLRRKVMEMTFGELIDKLTILRVKVRKNIDVSKHMDQIIEIESWLYSFIHKTFNIDRQSEIEKLIHRLYHNNLQQFDFEDMVFEFGGKAGLMAAKNSRKWNLKRAKIKQELDIIFGEKYLESKKYSQLNNL